MADEVNEVKPWMCPSRKHVLGQVVRNGSGVRVLMLYRNAVSLNLTTDPSPSLRLHRGGERAVEVDVMAVVEGYVADVRCDLCGMVRTWVPGEEALRKLLETARENAQ